MSCDCCTHSSLQKLPGTEATIEFLRMFDRLFDHMNTRKVEGEGYKASLSLNNRHCGEIFLKNAQEYIKSLFSTSKNYVCSASSN